MIEIYKVLRQVYQDQVSGLATERWHSDFLEGYRRCLGLLLTALEKNPAYNMHIENQRLQQKLDEQELQLQQAREKVRELTEINGVINQQLANEKAYAQELGVLINQHDQSALKGQVAGLLRANRELRIQLKAISETTTPASPIGIDAVTGRREHHLVCAS